MADPAIRYSKLMSIDPLKEYESLPEGTRAELFRGTIYDMARPGIIHQRIVLSLARKIGEYIDEHQGKCEVVIAPFDVHMQKRDDGYENDTIVQPDVFVVCDPSRFSENRLEGSPDWIIEVVSPGNQDHDYFDKLALYRESGVREYWIVDPVHGRVLVYFFDNDDMDHDPVTIYGIRDTVKANIYDDLYVDFSAIPF